MKSSCKDEFESEIKKARRKILTETNVFGWQIHCLSTKSHWITSTSSILRKNDKVVTSGCLQITNKKPNERLFRFTICLDWLMRTNHLSTRWSLSWRQKNRTFRSDFVTVQRFKVGDRMWRRNGCGDRVERTGSEHVGWICLQFRRSTKNRVIEELIVKWIKHLQMNLLIQSVWNSNLTLNQKRTSAFVRYFALFHTFRRTCV